ncbi:hypothetical protein R6Q59_035390 [Mikania micrantha]
MQVRLTLSKPHRFVAKVFRGERFAWKAKSAKARLSALQNKNPARTGRSGYKGLKQKLDEIWTPLVESNPLLKDMEDVRSKLYVMVEEEKAHKLENMTLHIILNQLVICCTKLVLANGQAYPSCDRYLDDTVMHEHCIKVHVDYVNQNFLYISVPVESKTEEITFMKDTVNMFVQWPRRTMKAKVNVVQKPQSRQPKSKQTRAKKGKANSKGKHTETKIKDQEMQAKKVNIDLKKSKEGLNGIKIWYFYELSHEKLNPCAFLNTNTIAEAWCKFHHAEAEEHIYTLYSYHQDKEYFLAPYSANGYWTLFIIAQRKAQVYILDSLMKTGIKDQSSYLLTQVIQSAFSEVIFTWTMCKQQMSGWECGYMVIKYIYDFVYLYQKRFPDVMWDETSMAAENNINNLLKNVMPLLFNKLGIR